MILHEKVFDFFSHTKSNTIDTMYDKCRVNLSVIVCGVIAVVVKNLAPGRHVAVTDRSLWLSAAICVS